MLQSTWTIGLAATAYTGPPDAQGFGASWIVLSVIAWSVRLTVRCEMQRIPLGGEENKSQGICLGLSND